MRFTRFFPNIRKETTSLLRREDLFKLNTFFRFLQIFIILYIINRILHHFTNSTAQENIQLTIIPIAVLALTFFAMIFISCRVKKWTIPKPIIHRYHLYLDLIKVMIYCIITVTLIEVNETSQSDSQNMHYYTGFWLSAELSLLLWPTIMSLHTNIANLCVLFFYFVYVYFRFHGYQQEGIESAFVLIEAVPLVLFLYKFKVFDELFQETKKKRRVEGKIAQRVMNLLPDGVAIIDADGLKYINASMRNIMNVKDADCLKALYALENRQYVEDAVLLSAMKKTVTLPASIDSGARSNKSYKRGESRGFSFYKNEYEKVIKQKDDKSFEESPESKRRNKTLLKRSTGPTPSTADKNHTSNASEAHESLKSPLNKASNMSVLSKGRTSTKLLISKEGESPNQSRKSSTDGTGAGTPGISLIGIAALQRRMKRIVNRIEKSLYQQSDHRNVGEAANEILTKMAEEFAPDVLNGMAMSMFQKSPDKSEKMKMFMSKSLTFGNKTTKFRQSFGANHWAIVMQCSREKVEGTTQYLEIKLTPIVTKGKPALIILMRDVTEKEIIKQMEEKEKAQSRALASVSHEFRTPLNGILGMLDSLKEYISHELSQNYLLPAYNSAKMLLTLVNDILDFHQIKEHRLVLVPVYFDIRAKIEESLSLISYQAKSRGIKLKVEVDEMVPKLIFNDPNRMQQVVNNLLGNAIKFTLQGSITVRLELNTYRRILIRVIDTGVGIDSENAGKLFKAFGKIDSKQNRELNPQGVGLGLTISNALAKVLCSDQGLSGLKMQSELDKGSTFWFMVDDLSFDTNSEDLEDEIELKGPMDNMNAYNRKSSNQRDYLRVNSGQHFLTSITTLKESSPKNRGMAGLFGGMLLQDIITKQEAPVELDLQEAGRLSEDVHKRAASASDDLERILLSRKRLQKGPAKILVVDDVEVNHMVIRSFLSGFEVEVESAYNGRQAIEKIKERHAEGSGTQYLLAFLDVEMPIMNGLECASELRSMMQQGQISEIPIIAQSGHHEEEEVSRCKQAGMVDYLLKPVSKKKLLCLIAKWLQAEE